VTLAFQSKSGVSGAGPAEKRENEESPINWGHSYCNKLSLFRGAAEVEWITAFPVLFSIKMIALQLAKSMIAIRKAITSLDFGRFLSSQ
jgi:hypothetical protein